jgi:NAD(P)-dependent dehydrogenase (short-subunit alcohol dehydrogenase family)
LSPGDPPPRRRVCLITGAGGTLGNAFCRAHAADFDIVAVCRSRVPDVPSQYESFVDPLAPTADLPENRNRVFVLRADLEAPGQVERVVDVALAKFGRVDLLVNAAAYTRWPAGGLLDAPGAMADFDRHFAVHVGLPLQLAATMAEKYWLHRDRGNAAANRNVVNVSSIAGSRVFAGRGQGVYAAAKAALDQLTRHQAAEFAPFGVRVNAVAPDSFPQVVPTERVAAAIVELDRGDETGTIRPVLGAGG